MIRKRDQLTGFAALAAITLHAPALAQQESQAGSRGALEEIIVTTQRREASLQDVPVAVSAISEMTLQNRQVTESRDLARFVPSLKMSNNITSPTNLSPSLRGSLQQDASLVVAESPFGIYVDDVYVARLNGNNVTLADIERIEVLRGPQGTLYGRNTLAGAIKYVSRTPDQDPWAIVTAGVGNWDQYRLSASVGGPLSDDWAGSLAGQINNKDNQFTNVATGERTGQERNIATRGKLRYMGSDVFDAVVSMSYSRSENDSLQLVPRTTPGVPSDCTGLPASTRCQFTSNDLVAPPGLPFRGVATPSGLNNPAPITEDPSGETKQTILSLNMSYDLGPATLRSITGYVKVDDFFSTDFSGAGVIVGAAQIDNDHWSQELQIQGLAFDDRLNYIAGAYYFRETGDQAFGWRVVTPSSTSQIQAKTTSVALFAQADYQLTPALKGTLGVRWVEDDKDFGIQFQRLPTSLVPGAPTDAVALENSYSEITPRFGLDYTIEPTAAIDTMLLYVSAARGFKSGGYNGIALFGLEDARTAYGPESNWTYEAGIKTDLFDRRLRINANYFLAKVSDLALNATVEIAPGLLSFPVQNAGDATIQGLEFEITAVPLDGLSLFLNGALTDAKYDRVDPTSAPAVAVTQYNVANPEPPQNPDYTVTVGFDYGVDLMIGGNSSRFKIGGDFFRTDRYVTSATTDFLTSAYHRTSAYTGLEIGNHWEVRFDVRNLTDEETIATGGRALGGFVTLAPREYMLSATYRL